MNKKILLSSLFISTIALVGCGKVEMNSFEEEMKAEQGRYVENLNNYFSYVNEFQEGKMTSNGGLNFALEVDDSGKIEYDLKHNTDFILEGEKIAFSTKMKNFLGLNIFKNPKNEELKELSNSKIDSNLDLNIGFVDEKLYLSLDDFNLKVSNPESNQVLSALELFNFDTIKEKFAKKWVFVDFKEELLASDFEDLSKSIVQNKILTENLQKSFILLASADIFEEVEKTTYNGKNAYKFKINEEKFQKFVLDFSEDFLSKNGDSLGLQDSELKDVLENIQAGLSSISIEDSEGYLVKTSKNNSDLIIKNISIVNNLDEKVNLSFEILDRDAKISISGEDFFTKLEFKGKSKDTIAYKVSISTTGKEKDTINFDGIFKTLVKKDTSYSEFTFNTILENIEENSLNFSGFEKIKLNITFKDETKKVNNLVIDEKSILGENTAMSVEDFTEYLDLAFPFASLGGFDDEFEDDYYNYDDFDFEDYEDYDDEELFEEEEEEEIIE